MDPTSGIFQSHTHSHSLSNLLLNVNVNESKNLPSWPIHLTTHINIQHKQPAHNHSLLAHSSNPSSFNNNGEPLQSQGNSMINNNNDNLSVAGLTSQLEKSNFLNENKSSILSFQNNNGYTVNSNTNNPHPHPHPLSPVNSSTSPGSGTGTGSGSGSGPNGIFISRNVNNSSPILNFNSLSLIAKSKTFNSNNNHSMNNPVNGNGLGGSSGPSSPFSLDQRRLNTFNHLNQLQKRKDSLEEAQAQQTIGLGQYTTNNHGIPIGSTHTHPLGSKSPQSLSLGLGVALGSNSGIDMGSGTGTGTGAGSGLINLNEGNNSTAPIPILPRAQRKARLSNNSNNYYQNYYYNNGSPNNSFSPYSSPPMNNYLLNNLITNNLIERDRDRTHSYTNNLITTSNPINIHGSNNSMHGIGTSTGTGPGPHQTSSTSTSTWSPPSSNFSSPHQGSLNFISSPILRAHNPHPNDKSFGKNYLNNINQHTNYINHFGQGPNNFLFDIDGEMDNVIDNYVSPISLIGQLTNNNSNANSQTFTNK